MEMGRCLFVRNSSTDQLERDMKAIGRRFPLLQIMFVVINSKGDPAYGMQSTKIQCDRL